MATEDLYEVLQVSPSAEPEVIDAAYRRLARMHHPDADKSYQAEREMKRLNAAYDVLGSPERRRAYDRARTRSQPERHEYRPSYLEEARGRPITTELRVEMTRKPKSEFLAGCLTLLIPGLGQVYAGQAMKGLAVFVVFLLLLGNGASLNLLLGSSASGGLVLVFYVAALFDAVLISRKRSAGRKVGEFEFF